MAYAFDTLGYAKRLRDAGISQGQAEAHAEAYGALEAKHEAVQMQLQQTEAMLARAQHTASRHAQRVVHVTGDVDKERLAREHAEKSTHAEHRAREEAEQALRQKNDASGFWKNLLRAH